MILVAKVRKYSVFLICILSACHSIVGKYVANTPGGPDTLIIRDSNKYTRICYPGAPEDMSHFTDTGSWYRSLDCIYFKDWIDRNGMIHYGDNKTHVLFGTDIKNRYLIGEIELTIDYDMEYFYRKVK